MNRRNFLTILGAAMVLPATGVLAQEIPSEDMIMQRLDAAPQRNARSRERVTINEFKRRPELRRAAPSIDIQAINFASGSAEIAPSEFRKIRNIGRAMTRIIARRPRASFLIEGHTDAVGSASSNQILSERRAASLKVILVREFGVPPRALETVGYGEEFLLVNT